MTRTAASTPSESADGKSLYYAKADASGGIWRMPVSGGEATEVLPGPVAWTDWALSRSGIYFLSTTSAGAPSPEHAIRHLDFASGQVTDVYRKEGSLRRQWLAVSPDEKWILYTEHPPWTSELMMVENFR